MKVIDTSTNTLVSTITTGNTPQALAVSPNGDRLYVSNLGDGTVTVIDTTTNTVAGNPIDVGGAAPAIAVSPDGNTLYASGFDDQTGSGRITVVDLTGNQANQTINTDTPTLTGLSVSPDGTKLYGTGNFLTSDPAPVIVIDLTTSETSTLDGSSGSVNHALSPDGTNIYVTNMDGKVHVYDTATGAEATPIDVGSTTPLYGISVSPDGRQALVTDITGTIHVIDTATGTQTGTIAGAVDEPAFLVQYTPNGAGAYVLTGGSSTALKYITGNTANSVPQTFLPPWLTVRMGMALPHTRSASMTPTATRSITSQAMPSAARSFKQQRHLHLHPRRQVHRWKLHGLRE